MSFHFFEGKNAECCASCASANKAPMREVTTKNASANVHIDGKAQYNATPAMSIPHDQTTRCRRALEVMGFACLTNWATASLAMPNSALPCISVPVVSPISEHSKGSSG